MVCEKFFNVNLTRRSCLTAVFDTNCLNLPDGELEMRGGSLF